MNSWLVLGGIIGLSVIGLALCSLAEPSDVLGPEYVRRIILGGNASVADIDRFPARPIAARPPIFHFVEAPNGQRVADAFRRALAKDPKFA